MSRAVPVPALYRALMAVCEQRRAELGWSMSTTDDKSGLNDGHYSKMLYPDTPSGRMANLSTVELALCALFGRGYTVQIVPDGTVVPSALGSLDHVNAKSREIRHWRHTRHFRDLGAKGGRARTANPNFDKLQSKAAKAKWRRYRRAKRLAASLEREGDKIAAKLSGADTETRNAPLPARPSCEVHPSTSARPNPSSCVARGR
ncbi:MAG: hypothetical protein LC750_00425 [Actinobacteria bacterium]|nr:hypothetical protein [Actinomycetota bacterium]